jgi:predicted permease
MLTADRLWMRIKMLFVRGRAGEELQRELKFHLEQQIEENVNAGMSPREARQAALRLIGNPELLREQTRDTWGWRWLELILNDVRQGIRRLVRTPGFSWLAILVMGLGIGANVALFTVVKSVLLNPLPFHDQDRLVRIYEADSQGVFNDSIVAGGSFARWQSQSRSFDQMAIKLGIQYDVADEGGQLPEMAAAQMASWNFFPMLGVQPALGRSFLPSDDKPEASATVILTWGLWKRRYGGDLNVIGKTLQLDARKYTIIGVLPASFSYPDSQVQLWTPLYHERSRYNMAMYDAHNFDVVGRLKPGVSIAQANAELTTLQRGIRRQFPQGAINDATSIRPILDAETYKVKTGLYTLLGATGCLLLIACLNTANLLVARSATRRRETAVRTALGSSRIRLVREQVVESVLLACAGGGLGFLLAEGALQWLIHARPDIPRVESIHMDGSVILAATGIMLLCGLLAGVLPALSSSDRQILQALHESSRAHSGGKAGLRLRRVLLAVQVALTVVLLVGSGLLIKSYRQLRSVDLGCATNNVLTMRIKLPKGSYNSAQKMSGFDQQVLERVKVLPGVKAVGLTTQLPGEGRGRDDTFRIAEHPPLPQGQVLDASTFLVDPGYFSAIQIPLLQGQFFGVTQPSDAVQPVEINEELARTYFGGEDPLGKHIVSSVTDDEKTYTVAGVVANTLEEASGKSRPAIYFPIFMGTARSAALVIRSAKGVDAVQLSSLALPVQKAIASIDPSLPVYRVLTMDQILGESTIDASFDSTLLLAFAVISLVLATVGLFGVLSYITTQRKTEIGVRLALGAQRGQVLRLMLKEGIRPAFYGLVVGLIASVGTTRLIQSMLYNTAGMDAGVFAAVSVALLMAAALACLIPAWRASRVDPIVVLRME